MNYFLSFLGLPSIFSDNIPNGQEFACFFLFPVNDASMSRHERYPTGKVCTEKNIYDIMIMSDGWSFMVISNLHSTLSWRKLAGSSSYCLVPSWAFSEWVMECFWAVPRLDVMPPTNQAFLIS